MGRYEMLIWIPNVIAFVVMLIVGGKHLVRAPLTSPTPASAATDITLGQFMGIQEKGVSAWAFEPDYESNPAVDVAARTEVLFTAGGAGMAPEEGGACCVQSNLPLPKLNEVYYWEAKIYDKPESSQISIGLTTKPYPLFRLPGKLFTL